MLKVNINTFNKKLKKDMITQTIDFSKEENNSFGFDLNLYNSNKKSFSVNEIPISFGNQKGTNFNQNIFNSDHKHNKKIIQSS